MEEYKSFLKEKINSAGPSAKLYRGDYEFIFAEEISVIRAKGNESFVNPDLGENVRAAQYSRDRFKQTLGPALGVMRNDANSKLTETVESNLSQENRNRVVMDPELLRQRRAEDGVQTELTPAEDRFLRSVRLLSKTNPYLVAMIRADRAFASVYIRRALEKISRRTHETLTDGSYTPLLVIGTGPAALTSIGEITRQNPALMEQALVVDKAARAGGPFSVDGKAWGLNSANQSMKSRFLGDAPLYPEDDESSITYYGDPTRWIPGQRSRKSPQKRRGDINTLASFSARVDDISDELYPDNENLTLILQGQMCISVTNYAAETEVLRVRPADEDSIGGKGNKIATIRITDADGTQRVIDIRTDAIITASGGGEAFYGFPLEGTRAERIVDDSKQQEEAVPNVCTSLEAFKAFVSRYETDHLSGLGKQLVIYGKGNSLDTLLEYIIATFSGENSRSIKEIVEKIVVIAPGAPKDARDYLFNKRTRYARVAEEIDRAGLEKLITFVDARVGDYDYIDDSVPVAERKMAIYDETGRRITLPNGQPIEADNIIAATGFKKDGDAIFERDYKAGSDGLFEPLVLPTNKDIPVAEVLAADPTIMRVGVSGKTSLSKEELLEIAKRSPEAAKALTRVGAVNFVAIGVQGRRTEAATNILLQKILNNLVISDRQRAKLLLRGGRFSMRDVGFQPKIGIVKNEAEFSFNPGPVQCRAIDGVLPNNLTAEESIRVAATSFIAESMSDTEYYLSKNTELDVLDSIAPQGKKMNGQLTFRVTLTSADADRAISDDPQDVRNLQFNFSKAQYRQRRFGPKQAQGKYEDEVNITLLGPLGTKVTEALQDKYVQATLVKLMKNAKRRPPAIDITLGVRAGKISYPHTFLEMVSSRG